MEEKEASVEITWHHSDRAGVCRTDETWPRDGWCKMAIPSILASVLAEAEAFQP